MSSAVALPGGRRLAYAEYGDPRGKPVLLFHGVPGSRLFRPPLDEITARMGARLITVDRPGMGESDYQPGRRILDWPADVAALADHLGLDRFAVSGHSGGGPYVFACAALIPQRLTAAAVLAGLVPSAAPDALRGITALNRLGLTAGRHLPCPRPLPQAAGWPFWRLGMYVVFRRAREHPEGFIGPNLRDPSDPDNAMLAMPGALEICRASTREAFRQGVLGHARDGYLITRPWGFQLEDIRMPVHLWHGEEDNDAPVGMGREAARRIPDCRPRFLPRESHLFLFKHWEEILGLLLV